MARNFLRKKKWAMPTTTNRTNVLRTSLYGTTSSSPTNERADRQDQPAGPIYTEVRSRKFGSRISRSVSVSVHFQIQDFLDVFWCQQLADSALQNVFLVQPDENVSRDSD